MNEINFIDIEPIGEYKTRFKCYDESDGIKATFHLYGKGNSGINYRVDFEITRTKYNTDIENQGKPAKDTINNKYGSVENCFKMIGIKYIKERIKSNDLKDETVNILSLI